MKAQPNNNKKSHIYKGNDKRGTNSFVRGLIKSSDFQTRYNSAKIAGVFGR